MSGSLKSMFEQQGIDVIMGKGKIVDEYTIDVEGNQIQADFIVVATGQHSNKLDIDGKNSRMIVVISYQWNLYPKYNFY